MQQLFDAGVEMRTVTVPGGGFAILHAKTFVIDDHVILTGSPNATENGMNNSLEDFWVLRDREAVVDWTAEFARIWNSSMAKPVDKELMKTMMTRAQDKAEKKKAEAAAREAQKAAEKAADKATKPKKGKGASASAADRKGPTNDT